MLGEIVAVDASRDPQGINAGKIIINQPYYIVLYSIYIYTWYVLNLIDILIEGFQYTPCRNLT